MTELDLFTTSFVTAVVVISAGVVFLFETVVRRESGSGRYWAASFVAGILTTFCYVAWSVDRDLWLAVALGNAAFVTQMGMMWLGCRVYNGRLGLLHRWLVAGVVFLALAAAALDREAGDWAGAAVLFTGVALFAALGALETLRGALRAVFAAWGLTFVLGIAGVYYALRTVVFLAAGPDSSLFAEWFDTRMASFVTIPLTIIAVVTTSVLRVTSVSSPPVPGSLAATRTRTVLLPREIIVRALEDVAGRSERAATPLAVVVIRISGLAEIATAFGPETAELIESSWHDALHRHLAPLSPAGALDDVTACVVIDPHTADEAAAAGDDLRQNLIDELASLKDAVLPAIGVGFALTEDFGYDAGVLVAAAAEAAERSATTSGLPVVRAER
ncbi:hypothetical protein [Microbacterium rhizophilus]|uniref:hypothetical protein n=1 Tax=Microbacterium rhizophilus TaxID=3138934 RepID=UPI0031F0D03D